MNNNSGVIRVDNKAVLDMFREFKKKDRLKVFRSAIRRSLNVVKRKATKNLKEVITPAKVNKKDKWGNSLSKGIRVKVAKNGMSGKVHIMGNFKLKFFEMGTADRYIKRWKGKKFAKDKRPFRGRITATSFYTRAINSEEKKVFDNIHQMLVQSIIRINNKYKNK